MLNIFKGKTSKANNYLRIKNKRGQYGSIDFYNKIQYSKKLISNIPKMYLSYQDITIKDSSMEVHFIILGNRV